MTDTKAHLKKHVKELVKYLNGSTSIKNFIGEDITGTKASILIDNALETTYNVNKDGLLVDFELLLTFGGSNIWCDSTYVYGSWGSDFVKYKYVDGIDLLKTIACPRFVQVR